MRNFHASTNRTYFTQWINGKRSRVNSTDGCLTEKGTFAFAVTDRGKQQAFRTSHMEDRRHSGHYLGKREDISDTTQGRQKTFRTPRGEDRRHFGNYIRMTEHIYDTTQGRQNAFRTSHRKTEDISDTKQGRIIADITDHPKASIREPAAAEHISHSAAWLVLYPHDMQRLRPKDYPWKIKVLSTAPPALCCWEPIFSASHVVGIIHSCRHSELPNYNSWEDVKTHKTISSRHKHWLSINALGKQETKCTNVFVTFTAMELEQGSNMTRGGWQLVTITEPEIQGCSISHNCHAPEQIEFLRLGSTVNMSAFVDFWLYTIQWDILYILLL